MNVKAPSLSPEQLKARLAQQTRGPEADQARGRSVAEQHLAALKTAKGPELRRAIDQALAFTTDMSTQGAGALDFNKDFPALHRGLRDAILRGYGEQDLAQVRPPGWGAKTSDSKPVAVIQALQSTDPWRVLGALPAGSSIFNDPKNRTMDPPLLRRLMVELGNGWDKWNNHVSSTTRQVEGLTQRLKTTDPAALQRAVNDANTFLNTENGQQFQGTARFGEVPAWRAAWKNFDVALRDATQTLKPAAR